MARFLLHPIKLHCKNTCVGYTQICVLWNTLLVSYMNNTNLCYFNTTTCVKLYFHTSLVLQSQFTCVYITKDLCCHVTHDLCYGPTRWMSILTITLCWFDTNLCRVYGHIICVIGTLVLCLLHTMIVFMGNRWLALLYQTTCVTWDFVLGCNALLTYHGAIIP